MSFVLTKQQAFHLGPWLVLPDQNKLKNAEESFVIEPKLMEVLCFLAQHPAEVISSDQLINNCWPNQFISDNPVHKCIALLRKSLKDDAKNPRFIKTVPKRGYTLIAPVKHQNKSQSESIQSAFWQSGSPFLGLEPYSKDHQSIFFGRSQAISEIKLLINQIAEDQHPFLLLSGPSGVGKTSLIKAGIAPYLINPAYPFPLTFEGMTEFVPEIKKEASSTTLEQNLKALLKTHELMPNENNDLSDDGIRTELSEHLHIIFIDQIERIFDQDKEPEHINAFFELLLQLLQSKKFLIIAAVRDEYYSQLMRWQTFQEIKKHSLQYDLAAPDLLELRQIVTHSTAAAGLEFEFDKKQLKRLDEIILQDARQLSNPLPLLSYTLAQLYQKKTVNQQLTFKAYNGMGGLTGAMATQAEKTYNQLSQQAQEQFYSLLYHLIKIRQNAVHPFICQRVPINTLRLEAFKEIITAFTNAHLFQTEHSNDMTSVRISHDRLLTEWKRVSDWLDSNRQDLNRLQELRSNVQIWDKHQESSAYLITNAGMIENLRRLTQLQHIRLSPTENRFIKKSFRKHKLQKYAGLGGVALLLLLLTASTFQTLKLNQANKYLYQNNTNAEKLISFMLDDMKQYLSHSGTLEVFGDLGTQVMSYYEQYPLSDITPASKLNQINAMNILGEVEVNRGNYDLAQSFLSRSLQLSKLKPIGEKVTENLIFQTSQTQYWLGYIAFLNKKHTETESHWQEYLKEARQLSVMNPDKTDWQLEASYALNNLGTLAITTKQLEKAADYFQRSAQIKRQLQQKHPENTQYIADLADTVSWQANTIEKLGDLRHALSFQQQSLQLTEKLVELDNENTVWLHRLGLANYRTALNHYNLAEIESAKQLVDRSLQLFQQLYINDSNNQTWRQEYVNQHLLYAKVMRYQQQPDKALIHISQAQTLYQGIAPEKTAMAISIRQLSSIQTEASLIYSDLGQHETAIRQISDTIQHFQKAYADQNSDKTERLAHILLVQGLIHANNDQLQIAKNIWQQAMDMIQPVLSDNIKNQRLLATYVTLAFQLDSLTEDDPYALALSSTQFFNPDYNWRKSYD
ncbi:winged helix-turn-helix domain-containing protein [Marinicella sp. W31]|uniref:nSTAND1 domain-containing NTPase n=1 Tax=Marinicella sp. W31 TaxID=3023713 RepID=UPI0037582626